MARHNGKGMIVKHGSNVVDHPISFSITEEVAVSDATAAGDDWEDHTLGAKKWSGSIEMRADFDAGANQSLRAGDEITFEGYSDGDATAKTFFTGTATVASHGVNVSHTDTVGRTYDITGKGALSVSVVS